MHTLDRLGGLVAKGISREAARAGAIARLETLVEKCNEAIKIWQEYQKSPGAPGDKWSVLSWVGSARAKRLHEIGLEANDAVLQACALLDGRDTHPAALEDSVIEMAYRQLGTGESGTDAATTSVRLMQERVADIRKLMQRVKTAPVRAAKKTAAKPAKKKTAGKKKSAPKKAAKAKATKKKTLKKSVKKPAKKKTAGKKKSAPKKKPAKAAAKKKSRPKKK